MNANGRRGFNGEVWLSLELIAVGAVPVLALERLGRRR